MAALHSIQIIFDNRSSINLPAKEKKGKFTVKQRKQCMVTPTSYYLTNDKIKATE